MDYLKQYDNIENNLSLTDENRKDILELIGTVQDKDLGFEDIGAYEDIDEFIHLATKLETGYSLPFPSLESKFLVAPHELTLVSGYTGFGKTELVNQILLNCIDQGAKGAITSLELTSVQLKKRLYQQSTGEFIDNSENYKKFKNNYSGKLKIWNGTKMHKLEELLSIIELYYVKFDHTVFVLDNMMMLGAGPDQYNKQYETVNEIKNMTKKYPISVFLVAHPRKPKEKQFVSSKNRDPYSFDVPSIYDVSGSATIANLVDNYMAVGSNTVKAYAEREIDAGRLDRRDCEEILKYGDVMLKREKKREHGKLFNQELFFDHRFRSFKENLTDKIKPLVKL